MANVVINKIRAHAYYNFTFSLDGNRYRFRIRADGIIQGAWVEGSSKWIMSIKGLNNDTEVNGIALLPGKNLLNQYGLPLGELWLYDNSGANEDPNFDDMGTRFTLEYIPKT